MAGNSYCRLFSFPIYSPYAINDDCNQPRAMKTMETTNPHPGLLRAEDVAAMFPTKDGKPMHVYTIHNWITKGLHGVCLTAWKPGKRYYTTTEAVHAFLENVEAAKKAKTKAVASHARPTRTQTAKTQKALSRHGLKTK